jgi:large subunit ribosomal protein L11
MAWKIQTVLELEIPAGKAQPSPPLWPMLWANGVNIGQFTKEFNEKTKDIMQQFAGFDMKVKCTLTVYVDRTFDLKLGGLVTSNLILRKLKLKSGSGEPNTKKIGKIGRKDLEEIVELKKWDMNTNDLESMIAQIAGTAKNMWVEVDPSAVHYRKERDM